MLKFKVGDTVQSAPDSSDVTTMKAVWKAVVTEVKGDNDDGGCYETLGTWEPIVDDNGNSSEFWKDNNDVEPTLRQLWGSHLEVI